MLIGSFFMINQTLSSLSNSSFYKVSVQVPNNPRQTSAGLHLIRDDREDAESEDIFCIFKDQRIGNSLQQQIN